MALRKTYNSKDYSTRAWIEEGVKKGVDGGALKLYFSGTNSSCRIQERDTYLKNLTDVSYLIVNGLYPVYLKWNLNLDVLTRKTLEAMIDGGNPLELFQVYQYVCEESELREDYNNLPFIVVDKELIYKMKAKRLEMEEELKETTVDGYMSVWKVTENIESTVDEFIDPESCFCEEYNNGGKKGYVRNKYDGREEIKMLIEKSIKNGNFIDVMLGTKEEYKVSLPAPMESTFSDMYYLIRYGLYPLYLDEHYEIKDITRETIDEMVDSDDPVALYQAYQYAASEALITERYCHYPFTILDKDLINRMKKKRIEMEQPLKETNIDIMSAWQVTKNNEEVCDVFNNTDEFFKELAESEV
ncbi:MAG: hypothetical protein J5802_10435 [Butyrivibrio sp.]|nr:hypothetical protein [Butyrivibrio sp.]